MPSRTFLIPAALALAVAACSSSTPIAGSSTPASTTTAAPAPSQAGSPGSTVAPAPTAPPPDTTADDTTGTGTGTSSPASPPRAGTYHYAQDGSATYGPFTIEPDVEGTLQIDTPNNSGGAPLQRQTRTYSDQQSMEQVLQFRAGGVYLLSFVSRFATESQSCDLDEPLLVLELPVKVGSSWRDTSSCDGLDLRIDGRVARTQTRAVGDTEVRTFVVRTTVRAVGDDIEQTVEATAWVSPVHRLIVRMVEESRGTAGAASFHSSRTDELLSLSPA